MTVMLSQRIEEIVKTLPECSISDVEVTSDENKIVFNFNKLLDKYYFLDREVNYPSDLDSEQISELQLEDEKCWDDFVLDFCRSYLGWMSKKVKNMPKKLLDDFLAINKSGRPIMHITDEGNSLVYIWNYTEDICEIAYPNRFEVNDIASRFSLEEILSFLPEEKKRIEANNIVLREGEHGIAETPEAQKLRTKFKKALKKRSAELFKELADILVSSLPSFLDEVPGLLARQLINYDLTDIFLPVQSK